MTHYPHLFAPTKIRGVSLPNRVIMGSMHVGFEERPDGAARLAAFYQERARNGPALIVTGGVSPNLQGRLTAESGALYDESTLDHHRQVVDAVHAVGGRLILQLLHAGRYAAHPDLVAPSAIQAPISPLTPRALETAEVEATIEDYVRASVLAAEAGYDGVEIMGSEGYLINEFTAPRTNPRDDAWGGSLEGRLRFPTEIMRRVRAAVPSDFLLIYRISAIDLVPDGSTRTEIIQLAHQIEDAGADLLNTGIGWHEARVPTIASSVPRGAFAWASRQLREAVDIPVIAVNRINTPEVAEGILARGDADFVSLARPFLADPRFVEKAQQGESHLINTCIGCNQACLDHTFTGREATCLVNPRAGRETTLILGPTKAARRIAVIGAGPAGLACATTAAARGHHVTLFDAHEEIGGQLNVALQVPGKQEFRETLRYFTHRIAETGVQLKLGVRVSAADVGDGSFDEVVLATGVHPRIPEVEGIDRENVHSYLEVLRDGAAVGDRVVVMGAGGIGFDVTEELTDDHFADDTDPDAFIEHWGIDTAIDTPGGLTNPREDYPARKVIMLQRREGKLGAGLGPTTGWIHRLELARRGVEMRAGVEYVRVDEGGLTVREPAHNSNNVNNAPRESLIAADTIVVCAGQEPARDLVGEIEALGITPHLIGGAAEAGELDAKRAIDEGTRLAATW